MLAKEIKIRNIKKQRGFIENQLRGLMDPERKDGDTAYRYTGQILPEVIEHFTNEGFKVERISSDEFTAATKGLPAYLFTISDQVVLTDEDLENSRSILAKEIKIKNIRKQREFIEEQLSQMLDNPREDGSTAYRYVGQVLPEVIDYFTKEGFKVEHITSSGALTVSTMGLPVYLFTISDEVVLTDEELQEAEEVEIEPDDEEMPDFDRLLSSLLGDDDGDGKKEEDDFDYVPYEDEDDADDENDEDDEDDDDDAED